MGISQKWLHFHIAPCGSHLISLWGGLGYKFILNKRVTTYFLWENKKRSGYWRKSSKISKSNDYVLVLFFKPYLLWKLPWKAMFFFARSLMSTCFFDHLRCIIQLQFVDLAGKQSDRGIWILNLVDLWKKEPLLAGYRMRFRSELLEWRLPCLIMAQVILALSSRTVTLLKRFQP